MSVLKKLSHLRISRYFRLCFVLWDLFLLNLAVFLSLWLYFGPIVRIDLKEVQTISLLSNMFWIFILLQQDAHRSIRIERIESILFRTIKHFGSHIALIGVFMAVLQFQDVSRVRLGYFYVVFFILLIISRISLMKVLKYIRKKGYNFKNVVIIGANDKGKSIQKVLSKDLTYGYRVLGFFDDAVDPFALISSPLLGGFDAIEEYIAREKVDEMYIALHLKDLDTIKKLTTLCDRNLVRIKFIPDFQQYTRSRRVEITFYENTPVLMLRTEPMEGTVNLLLKRVFDIVFSLLVIGLIFPWLFPIIVIMIKMDSAGPVFLNNSVPVDRMILFLCYKFRTMQVNTDSDQLQATKGDSRVTKMGVFMRRTNIDELPQFFNVFFGTMSVVGPRPHMLKHTEQYSELINNYLVRHYAKPGITGWAQVNGYRGETKELIEMRDRVDYDIWYIENWSLLLDLKIVYMTVFNVFQGEENAY